MDRENKYGLKEIQEAELKLLKRFIQVCEENHFRYYVIGGTLLGCVRHGGFIPWDDDIDIGMPRQDFEKMKILLEGGDTNSRYRLLTYTNSKGYTNYVPKYIDSSITITMKSAMEIQEGHPWIDIFPMDGMPKSKYARLLYFLYALFVRLKVNYSCFSKSVDMNKKKRPMYEKILIFFGKHVPVEHLFNTDSELKKFDKVAKRFDYDLSSYIVNYMGAYKFREIFPKDKFSEIVIYDFEDIKVKGPKEYDYILKQIYGEYMIPPETNDRNQHGLVGATSEINN